MFERSVLDNGLRILTSPMSHTRSVTIALFIASGSRHETDEQGGAFHFIEHLLFKGTSRRPTAREISEAIEGVGGLMNGSTDREVTTYWCKVARPHFAMATDVLMDILRNSLFVPEEVEKERGVILEELAMSNDQPDEQVGLLIDQVLWPGQPIGRDVGGTPQSVKGLSRGTLLDFMRRGYLPSNTVVAVSGDITHQEVVELLSRDLNDWVPGEPMPWLPVLDGQVQPQVRMEPRRTDQAHICLAVRGLASNHPQRYTLDLLNAVLGEGMSSRLFLELREHLGLVYSINSFNSHFRDAGALMVYCSTHPKNATQVITTILEELEKLKVQVPETELSKVKEMLKGRLLLRMEDTRSVAFWHGIQEILLDRIVAVDETIERIEAVTAEEIQHLAQSLMVPQNLNLAVVGPYRSAARFERVLA